MKRENAQVTLLVPGLGSSTEVVCQACTQVFVKTPCLHSHPLIIAYLPHSFSKNQQ